MSAEEVIVPGWQAPKGYSNGRIGAGRAVHIGGQIGWNIEGKFPERESLDGKFTAQVAQTLDNVIAVVKAAGGEVTDLAAMTVFVIDMPVYRRSRKELAAIWKQRLGTHYPAMALVAVTELFEPEALVEIEAIAYIGAAP